MYHRDLCYASATNKLSYFIKRLLPVVFVQLRKASRKPGNSLHTLPFPHCSPLRVEAMLLMAQMIKTLPAVWETWVRSLGWEDPPVREWQRTPIFVPGEFHGQRSLVGYSPWGHKELDTAEPLSLHFILSIEIYSNSYTGNELQ